MILGPMSLCNRLDWSFGTRSTNWLRWDAKSKTNVVLMYLTYNMQSCVYTYTFGIVWLTVPFFGDLVNALKAHIMLRYWTFVSLWLTTKVTGSS